jgi:lysophospholipase L1-like esterase
MIAAVVVLTGTFAMSMTFKILPIGDSLTQGVGDPDENGYRGPLWYMLTDGGFSIDFVGTNVGGVFPDPQHDGWGGYTIGPGPSAADSWVRNGKGNIYDNIETYMAADPDIILLLIGANEFGLVQIPGFSANRDSPGRLDSLVSRIFSIKSTVVVFLSNLAPNVWSFNNPYFDEGFNRAVPEIVRKYASVGKSIHFVNMRDKSGIVSADLTEGGLHPLPAGYRKMAVCWLNQLKPFLQQASQGTVLHPAILPVEQPRPGFARATPGCALDGRMYAAMGRDFRCWTVQHGRRVFPGR